VLSINLVNMLDDWVNFTVAVSTVDTNTTMPVTGATSLSKSIDVFGIHIQSGIRQKDTVSLAR